MNNYDLVVFSHLRWEFVFQRPQHLISRFAKNKKVLFIEEPIAFQESEKNTARVIKSHNITVLQPRIGWEKMDQDIVPIAKKYIKDLVIKNPILWFYAPMYSHVIDKIDHSLVIFDSMDELKAFKGAPPELLDNEKFLLEKANIVFTGGKSLYDSKSKYHNNVHCYPSSVDRTHFEKSLETDTIVPHDIGNLPKPVVGYYGVIDERIDIELLGQIATLLPTVSFVMIGPVVKINENDLPKLPNIHYLGAKKYDELPNYLKGIDVAMMPFALNEATEFISPTKTLEFMAALKPIVSTAIYDVVREYKEEVAIAHSAKEFTTLIEKYINESPTAKKKREKLQKIVTDNTSWDKTFTGMNDQMNKALDRQNN